MQHDNIQNKFHFGLAPSPKSTQGIGPRHPIKYPVRYISYLLLFFICLHTKFQVYRQTDRRVHRRPTPKQYPSDFIGGKPVLSTGYLVSCSRTQRSASGEARTRDPSISGQALYHDCAPQLGSILCRYDTCPTQYAPDLRGSILCMQGTQYAPRESILCMEHFVALQRARFIYVR